jgi:hypothetical protein
MQARLDVLITLLRKETEAAAGPSAASASLSASPARAAHEITGLHWGAEFLPIAETSLSIFRYVTSSAVSSAPSCCRTLSVRSCLVFSRHSYYLMVGRRPKSYFILGLAPVLSFTCYLLLRPVALFCRRAWPWRLQLRPPSSALRSRPLRPDLIRAFISHHLLLFTVSVHRAPHLLCCRALEVQGVRLRTRTPRICSTL